MRLLFLFSPSLKYHCLLIIVSARTFYLSTHHHLITDVNLKVEFLGNTAIRLGHFWESNVRLWVNHCVISVTCSSHTTDISFEAFQCADIFRQYRPQERTLGKFLLEGWRLEKWMLTEKNKNFFSWGKYHVLYTGNKTFFCKERNLVRGFSGKIII